MAFLTNPIGLFIAAVAALGAAAYLLIKHWSGVKEFFSTLWDGIKSVFKDSIDAVMDYLAPLIRAVNMVIGGLSRIGHGVANTVGRAWSSVAGEDTPSSTIAPARATRGGSLDAGGEIKITIDQQNRAKVTEARSNDSRVQFQPGNTGALMGGF
jgi:hypothetical protein